MPLPPAPCPLLLNPHTLTTYPHTLNFAPTPPLPWGSGPVSITPGDFNGDGHLDLAVVNRLSDNVSLLLGNGSGSFNPHTTFAVGSLPNSITLRLQRRWQPGLSRSEQQ
ncbi:VCBS repeat-containing protein [[Phormidium] sp. ETS-05]|uniref:FG-GAP repeat domain-containing protein n=1 Tax=[Phormidium] sp. ETS-05 TaxID=222819 RepID=UPI0018EEE844|nr:VCBS repeat-containing protein [[Phormidium] sp. ETS-05]